MPVVSYVFNGGIVSALIYSRPDQPRYKAGCKELFNAVCIAQGSATRRPGLLHLGLTDQQDLSKKVRSIPFVFSATEARVLEFSSGKILVWVDDELVLDGSGQPYEITSPYNENDLGILRFRQSGDVMYIACANRNPRKLVRTADDDWLMSVISFVSSTQTPGSVSVIPEENVPTAIQSVYKYVVTAIDATTGEESSPSNIGQTTNSILNSIDVNINHIVWIANTVEPLEYRVYKYDSGVYGYIGSTAGDAATMEFVDINIGADVEDTPPSDNDPFTTTNEFPSLVFFKDQRLGWAASNILPFNFWISVSGFFESLATSAPPKDNEAIIAKLATGPANRIQWVADDRVLLTGTTGNEWSVGKVDEALTPSNISFTRQGGRGSEFIEPLVTGDSLLYVQRGGNIIREIAYNFSGDKYEAAEISLIASQLFDEKRVVNWCYQLNPFSIAWVLLDDGTLAGLTHLREHEVVGWHRHETDGFIEDICSVPGVGYDRVYIIVRRTLNSVERRYIERFDNYFIQQSDFADAFFVDAGVKYDGVETDELTDIAPHLAGETVKVWADGAEQTDQVVGATGTVNLTRAASKVNIGLPMVSDVVPVRPEIIAADGTTMTMLYKLGTSKLRLYKSAGVLAGANEDNLAEVIKHDRVDNIDPGRITGDVEFVVDTGWGDDWNTMVRAPGAGPMTLSAFVYDIELAEEL